MIEIGARSIEETDQEVFYSLNNQFPGSRLIGFEVDEVLCEEMNRETGDAFHYYAQPIGGVNGEVDFYETVHPMCASLLEPNHAFIEKYNDLDVMRLQTISKVNTQTLDSFVEDNDIGQIDFIKIDVQGAELDVFKNSESVLQSVALIVTEVEFVPIYTDQPLFGDVNDFLSQKGFMFHKFLSLQGRALKPTIYQNNAAFPSTIMWADAVFTPNIFELDKHSKNKLLKTAVLAHLYGSLDVSYHMLKVFDDAAGSEYADQYAFLCNKGP